MSAETTPSARTLVELLQLQADRYEDKLAFSFRPEGDLEQRRLTYRELDLRAREVAAHLQQQGAAGERVLIMCPPGLDTVAGIFGCFYAGAVAVPMNEDLRRLKLIAPEIHAGFALATVEMQAKFRPQITGLVERPVQWSAVDEIVEDAEKWVPPEIDERTTALIQYTSGSTTAPKGAMMSHGNFLSNMAAIRRWWGGNDQDFGVWWLPQSHDLGLIGGVLEMIYVGCSTVVMSPVAFIQRPLRWLEAISRYRGTVTAAPDFAYNMCIERTTPQQRAALDLSSLTTAWNGAEPVRAATLRAFAEAFAPAGFRPEAFARAYGLAEATLVVSAGTGPLGSAVRHVNQAALSENRAVDAVPGDPTTVEVVSNGRPLDGERVVVVDPETRRERGPGEVGEIWVAGPNVSKGYWGRPEETERIFGATLADTGEGPFLRTGDLGFFESGELCITGRWKDLVTLRDSHYYPNDIEATVQSCHPALLTARGAAFAVRPDPKADNQLVVVQEVRRQYAQEGDLTAAIDEIRAAITRRHGISAHDVLLVEQMLLPTTSSGKIQRGHCRQQFLDGELPAVAEWHAPPPPPVEPGTGARNTDGAAKLARALAVGFARRLQQTNRPGPKSG